MLTITIAAIFTDLILCLTPARMIWYSDLPKPQRVRLIIVFSTCLLTTIVSSSALVRHIQELIHMQASLAHAYCIWFRGYLDQWLAAAFEVSSCPSYVLVHS